MKKAFSMIELIVAMLILAFVFATVPMILSTTFDNTKTIINQDKTVKLQELYSILNMLPYGKETAINEVNAPNGFLFSSQDRVNNPKMANEMLGESDKFVMKTSSNVLVNDYIGKDYKTNIGDTRLTFNNGEKPMTLNLNSYSSRSDVGKWVVEIKQTDVVTNTMKSLSLIMRNNEDVKNENEIKMISYFSNIGRKKSNFYNESLPFDDKGSVIRDIYKMQLDSLK